jgi:pimeloyl-ACP methyl ester carboxylesterase
MTRRTAIRSGVQLVPALVAVASVARASEPKLDVCVRLPDGRQLGYAEYGDPSGRLVLYFHGTPGSRIEAHLIAEEAKAAKVRLVAVERPGIGLSDYKAGRTILQWPADVEHFVTALGYKDSSFGVVGMSGGAPYALACVHRMPQRITHAAIVSGHTPMRSPGVEPGNQDQLIEFICRRPRAGEIGLNAAIRMLHRDPNRFLQRASQHWSVADGDLIFSKPEYRSLFIRTVNEATRSGSAGLLCAIQLLGNSWGFRVDELPRAPVSIWQGGCDPIAPPSMGHYFHQQIAGSELIVDPKAGHLTMPKWHSAEILARFH